MTEVPNPGLRPQPTVRISLRIGGGVLVLVGIVLMIMWFTHFSSAMDSTQHVVGRATTVSDPSQVGSIVNDAFATSSSAFGGTWMMMVAVACLAIGSGMLRAGFMGATVRYAAGETMPVVKDSVAYLTDGEGLMGIGRIVDGDPTSGHHHQTQYATRGLFCQRCGTRNDFDANFCDTCGERMVR